MYDMYELVRPYTSADFAQSWIAYYLLTYLTVSLTPW